LYEVIYLGIQEIQLSIFYGMDGVSTNTCMSFYTVFEGILTVGRHKLPVNAGHQMLRIQ
jgi:hypothetical protein